MVYTRVCEGLMSFFKKVLCLGLAGKDLQTEFGAFAPGFMLASRAVGVDDSGSIIKSWTKNHSAKTLGLCGNLRAWGRFGPSGMKWDKLKLSLKGFHVEVRDVSICFSPEGLCFAAQFAKDGIKSIGRPPETRCLCTGNQTLLLLNFLKAR